MISSFLKVLGDFMCVLRCCTLYIYGDKIVHACKLLEHRIQLQCARNAINIHCIKFV